MGKSSANVVANEDGDGLMENMEGGAGDGVPYSTTTATTYGDGDDAVKQEQVINEEEIWLEREQENLLDVNDASMFYTDFPPLPDFPCMSSSSSSSSSRTTTSTAKPGAAAKSYSSSASSSSSSSAAVSWTVSKQQTEGSAGGENEKKRRHYDDHQADAPGAAHALLSSTASMTMELFAAAQAPEDYGSDDIDCINVVENFGCMDLLDNNDIWDPSSIFQFDNPQEILQEQKLITHHQDSSSQERDQTDQEGNLDQLYFLQGNGELAVIFLEWLKQNREYISAEDMRNIKLKRSTIECASKRLGSSKEGKKQLLKLILEWVEQYQLQRKRMKETAQDSPYPYHHEPPPPPNSDFNCNNSLSQDPNLCFSPSPWVPPAAPPHHNHASESSALQQVPPALAAMGGYIPCDPYSDGPPAAASCPSQIINGNIYPVPQTEYQPMDSPQAWNAQAPFAMAPHYTPFPSENCGGIPNAHQALYGNPYPYQVFDGTGVGERLVRLGSSATKEARKKRMARQRRLNMHQYRHNAQNQTQNHHQQQGRGSGENCTSDSSQPNANSWVYWSPAPPSSSTVPFAGSVHDSPNSHTINNPPERSHIHQQNQHRQASSDRRQGYKTEKNLKFLLQKVLKQSDVGNLGRIVLPKKEAETHLPELESRDGIPIAMEDIGTSNVWNMRYRFWPNNKSRMYLLENTGDFVRVNGLQEGDFIVIYSDTKCGKYLIRGVKVRQPGSKSEAKKPARRNMRNLTQAGAQTFSQLGPFKQTVK